MTHSSEPYCSNCGYQLTGLVDSSKCPECGRPLVEVLTRRHRWPMNGKRYRSSVAILGLPVLHIALGPHEDGLRGRARGIIAIGDVATGVLAIGGIARGMFAVGGVAIGLVSLGGMAVGLLACLGGCAVGGLAIGGFAAGLVAQGGFAAGGVADGGLAAGYIARGGIVVGAYPDMVTGGPSGASQRVRDYAWLIGPRPGGLTLWRHMARLTAMAAALACLLVSCGYVFARRVTGMDTSLASCPSQRGTHP